MGMENPSYFLWFLKIKFNWMQLGVEKTVENLWKCYGKYCILLKNSVKYA